MSSTSRSQLFGDLDVTAQLDAPIGAERTWFGIGGKADALVSPQTEEALVTLIERCAQSSTPVRILGKGANLLVDDDGVDGVVVLLDTPAFSGLKFNREGRVHRLHAMAGADLFKTVNELKRQGLAGMEQMAGIPGTIGGGLRMNAGGSYGCIGDTVDTVRCCSMSGEVLYYERSQLEFSYRKSNLPECIVLSATFNLEPDDPVAVRSRVSEIWAAKKASQPMADHSAGCAFRNPLDRDGERVPAGRLIDEAGLKGLAEGGASVSTQHGNFIITDPNATASHVRRLMRIVQDRVMDHHGIRLEPEVVIWERTGITAE
ncbi:MAG: UDP-N-acetylenolpyruvoylglucosamine reductase [Phycisphaerae bacterium]|nr:UDP-N-acetylenolpyruvoylglucosamine reductase [Phycisphaerae bacterium]|tara:strand:+ start:1236 stop:2186 length:951 start_codon:yes stop_codon:yes gene_type:complete